MKIKSIILGGVLASAGYLVTSGDANKIMNKYGLNEKFSKVFSLSKDTFEKKESYADAIFGNGSAEQADLVSENSDIIRDTVHVEELKDVKAPLQNKPKYDTVYVKTKEITDTVTVPSKKKVYIPLDNLIKQGKKIKIK